MIVLVVNYYIVKCWIWNICLYFNIKFCMFLKENDIVLKWLWLYNYFKCGCCFVFFNDGMDFFFNYGVYDCIF